MAINLKEKRGEEAGIVEFNVPLDTNSVIALKDGEGSRMGGGKWGREMNLGYIHLHLFRSKKQ